MSWITKDDFIETYSKFVQRGAGFFLSKLNINPTKRTKSSFDDLDLQASNWWIIPEVKQRWNKKISNSKSLEYEDYFVEKHLKGRTGVKLLSIGSGICSHEIKLAKRPHFEEVHCLDIAGSLLDKAAQTAKREGVYNMKFVKSEIDKFKIKKGYYDVIMFHQSLHHFDKIEQLLHRLSKVLKEDGLLLLHEYVGPKRLIPNREQLFLINKLLDNIPVKMKRRFKTNKIKTSVSGPGKLRMFISDPSEAVDSEAILPSLKKYFHTIEQKDLGGNILCLLLKDIAHHFLEETEESSKILERLFEQEDHFLIDHPSEMIFGVYRPKT